MATYQGMELQFVTPPGARGASSDKFYRMIRVDNTVFVRWGRRGAAGQTQTKHLGGDWEAESFFMDQSTAKQNKGYDVIYSTRTIAVPLPSMRTDFAAAEAHFLQVWTDDLVNQLSGHGQATRTTWVLVTGALAERGRDHGTDVVLDYLLADLYPHATDPSTDTLVAQLTGLPTLGGGHSRNNLDAQGPRTRASLLAPVDDVCTHGTSCAPCATRQAELMLGLASGHDIPAMDWTSRAKLASSAKRLIASSPHAAASQS